MIAQRRIKCISVLRVLNSFFNGISSSAITTIVYPGWREKWLNLFSLSVTNPFFDGSWNFLIICLNFEKIFFSSSNDDDRVSFLAFRIQAFRIHFSVDLSKFRKDSPFIERWLCILLEKRLNLFSIRVLNPFFVQFPHHLSKFQKDSPFIEQRRWPCIFLYFSMDHRSISPIIRHDSFKFRKDSLSIEQRLREAE